MGRYTLSLLRNSFPSDDTSSELVFIFSKYLPKDNDAIAQIKEVFPSAKTVELDLKTSERQGYKEVADHNKSVLDSFIADSVSQKRAFFIPCLFQEPTVSVFPDNIPKIVLYYDAIPLLYYEKYVGAINYGNYLARHRILFSANVILTISNTVSDDLALYLGIDIKKRNIVNIDGACIEDMMETFEKPKKIKIPKDYIVFPTSDDIRKNNRAAILALEQLRNLSKVDYKMIITSTFNENHKADLKSISSNIIFTGNVSDNELAWLYKNAQAVLFTSEYEGLGLPILEAVKVRKPVACSNIAVFREISSKAFYYFDPLDTEDITLRLYEALRGKKWEDKKALYADIDKHYTWKRSSKLFCDAVELAIMDYKPVTKTPLQKPKIAILAPDPQGYSAIGKVVQELHDFMSEYFDIEYYLEQSKTESISIRPNLLVASAICYDSSDFNARQYAKYDAVIYHIGNSEYHFETITKALYLPGFTVLHDTILSEAFGDMVKFGYMLGQRLEAEQSLDEKVQTTQTAFMTSIVNNQIGYIVHSEFAKKAVHNIKILDILSTKINLPVYTTRQSVLDQDKGAVHVGVGGVLSGNRKGLDIIKDLASDENISDKVVFHIFGFNLLEKDVVDKLKAFDNIRFDTNLSDLAYQTQLANLDILFNFRAEYRGETSLTALEAMRYGGVVVVNKELGWFGELPNDSVVKVINESQLSDIVYRLVGSPSERRAIAKRAREYTEKYHSPGSYAQSLAEFINKGVKTQSINAKRAEVLRSTASLDEVKLGIQKIYSNRKKS
jgi:glycosyltransferase involved in cell wall biosynthesis